MRSELACGISAGLLVAAAFPPASCDILIWIAFFPVFFFVLSGQCDAGYKALRIGWITGVTANLTSLYWIPVTMTEYAGMNSLFAFLVLFLLCAYLAFYYAIPVWLAYHLKKKRLPRLIWAIPFVWVVLEFMRGRLLTGFLWNPIGASLAEKTHLIQFASITGVYGVSFLIIFVNLAVVLPFVQSGKISRRMIPPGVAVVLLLLAWAFGWRAVQTESEGVPLRAAIIQGNIAQDIKWDPAFGDFIFSRYIEMTEEAAKEQPDLIVWPEAATPFRARNWRAGWLRIKSTVARLRIPLVFGSPDFLKAEDKLFNSGFVMHADVNKEPSIYNKTHLVPFGEYTPLRYALGFVDKIVPGRSIDPGTTLKPVDVMDYKAGLFICYESIFPGLVREFRRQGAQFFINLTNDGWFGMTAASRQHLNMVRFRCIENRLPLIRAANRGISAFIDDRGRIIKESGLYSTETLAGEITVPNDPRETVYVRYGDWFPFLSLIVTLAIIIRMRFARSTKETI